MAAEPHETILFGISREDRGTNKKLASFKQAVSSGLSELSSGPKDILPLPPGDLCYLKFWSTGYVGVFVLIRLVLNDLI